MFRVHPVARPERDGLVIEPILSLSLSVLRKHLGLLTPLTRLVLPGEARTPGAVRALADANYGPQIKVAQAALTDARKNAETITSELKTQGLLLRKVVGKGLGLKGYMAGGYTGAGAVNQMAGIVHAGEFVTNARATANPRNRMMLEALNRNGYPGYAGGGYVRPVYMRGGGSGGIDYDRLATALQGAASVVRPEFHAHAKENMDAQTAMTIMSREIGREFSGMER